MHESREEELNTKKKRNKKNDFYASDSSNADLDAIRQKNKEFQMKKKAKFRFHFIRE